MAEIRRYWYIVWRRIFYDNTFNHEVIDRDPADWLIAQREAADKLAETTNEGYLSSIIIINQFEITAEQYTRMESLQ